MIAVLRMLLLQCAAWAVALLLATLWPLSLGGLAVVAASCAALLAACCLRRPGAIAMHAAMPLLCALALQGAVPSWVWLLPAVVTWAIGAGAFRYRVPLYLSNTKALQRLESLIPPGAKVIDVGAGTGTVLAWLAGRRADLVLAGVELAWLPWLLGQLRFRSTAVSWRRADAFDVDLSGYDVIYAYLSPAPMPALWRKLCVEMNDGARLISNSFGIEGVPADARYPVGDWKQSELLVWHRPSQSTFRVNP